MPEPPAPSPRSLQSRTYLFCAIRPEVKYHAYTFSTCNFAKNASVVKLQPKKAVAASSPAERKLMEELEQMKVQHLLYFPDLCRKSTRKTRRPHTQFVEARLQRRNPNIGGARDHGKTIQEHREGQAAA